MDRPSLYDETADPELWSRVAVGGERLTWREAYEHERGYVQRLAALANVLSDLDRCEHGRHEGDVCGGAAGCNGPSRGNPHMQTGDVIGYTIDRRPIAMPERRERHDPAAWVPKVTDRHACCKANVPPLSFTRESGAEWECPSCGGRWIWDDDESEGGAWYWDPENDRNDSDVVPAAPSSPGQADQ